MLDNFLVIVFIVAAVWLIIFGFNKERARKKEEREARERQIAAEAEAKKREQLKREVEAILDQLPKEPPFTVSPWYGLHFDHRNEHTLICASTGHGKTELMKAMIGHDLEAVQAGEASVVVIDSQVELIEDILGAKEAYGPRTILIDPHDVDYPFGLSFLDIGKIKQLRGFEYEAAFTQAIDTIETILGSQNASFTQRQRTLFTFVFELLIQIDDATLLTLLDVLDKDGHRQYHQHYRKLSEPAQYFFTNEMHGIDGREYRETKTEVVRRIVGLTQFAYFRKMFSDPHPQFSFDEAFEHGTLILASTSIRLFAKEGSATFGKYIIAQTLKAAQKRLGSRGPKKPIYLYIDEADAYLDGNIELLLQQARKLNLGIIMAHTNLENLQKTGLLGQMRANTAHKLTGTLFDQDARKLASDFGIEKDAMDWFTKPKTGIFNVASRYPINHIYLNAYEHAPDPMATMIDRYRDGDLVPPYYRTFTRGVTTNVIGAYADRTHKATQGDRNALRDRMRARYSVKITAPQENEEENLPDDDVTMAKPRKS